MHNLKIYLDTSVINFLFADDAPELKTATVDFFDNFIAADTYDSYISAFVLFEINKTTDESKKHKLLSVIERYPISILDLSRKRKWNF